MVKSAVHVHSHEIMGSKAITSHGHTHHHDSHVHDSHVHPHGMIDPEIASSEKGLWAVKWSFIGLLITTLLQTLPYLLSDSVALLADLIHNIADAATAIPLGLAFWIGRRKPTSQFSYGYGRAEDLAGVAVVMIIALSAAIAGHESLNRLFHPQPLEHLNALVFAGAVGFAGNALVSMFRIRVGQSINSAALIADGYHARADSLVSLSVMIGAIGIGLGYPIIDPIMGLVITAILFQVVWSTGKTIFVRILDGVEPETVEIIHHSLGHIDDIRAVNAIRARWLGHRLHVETELRLDPNLSLQQSERIIETIRHELKTHIPYIDQVVIQVQPGCH